MIIKLLVVAAILLFVGMQVTRMLPSKRDAQLQRLRDCAKQQGLQVSFWTARVQRYQHHQLPASGFQYLLPEPDENDLKPAWALWINSAGETRKLHGQVPQQAFHFASAYQQRFERGWLLLEQRASGLGFVWEERGTEKDVIDLAASVRNLREQLRALPS